ncbi:hypothetical protein TNIN_232481 [Trichonephila inaurata madagascariensis]|uniref:Uncharacterized protein n=1 Tax=Trichonephila inaurata madagascariensis TaxID=2747483 RepID=A0A8X7CK42_9ARAC|nr:hypothetical protein TNIN_232481 [Trichonephila inaurata madagascariensis]
MFNDGRQETRDLTRPGQAHKVVTEKLILHIDTVIKGNRHRNIHDIANEFNVSIGFVLNWLRGEYKGPTKTLGNCYSDIGQEKERNPHQHLTTICNYTVLVGMVRYLIKKQQARSGSTAKSLLSVRPDAHRNRWGCHQRLYLKEEEQLFGLSNICRRKPSRKSPLSTAAAQNPGQGSTTPKPGQVEKFFGKSSRSMMDVYGLWRCHPVSFESNWEMYRAACLRGQLGEMQRKHGLK